MSSIVISGIGKRAGGVSVLNAFSLTVDDGEFATVLGPEKSGKTALLRILAGLEAPDSGRILIGGEPVADVGSGFFADPSDRGIGMVFESGALWPHMTVYQNVAFGLGSKGYGRQEIRSRVRDTLISLRIEELSDRLPKELSAVERQRAAMARALVGGFRTILIDELPSSMDREERVAIRGDIKRLHRDMGLTILFATRDYEEAMTVSTRVAFMDQGRLLQRASPIDLYLNPCSLYVAGKVGDPQINLIPAKAQVEDGLMTVQSALGIHQFTAESFTEHTRPNRLFDCLVGVRPELVAIGGERTPGAVCARVYSCQPSGSETIVQLTAGDQPLLAKCLGLRFFRADQQVFLTVVPRSVNIFDRETGTLIKRAALPDPVPGE